MQNVSFNGRCPQIKDAQWVCHTVNTGLPHISTTRFMPTFKKLVYSEGELASKNIKIFDMKKLLEAMFFIKDKITKERLIYNKSDKDLDMLKKISASIKFIERICYNRLKYEGNDPYNISRILNMLSNAKMGNCFEEAKVAELILLLNGIKNACTATLEARFAGKIEHILCVFNRDGSKFNGVINKNTIVIDPWAQKADFATNMLKFYRNMCKEDFDIPIDRKLDITPISKMELTEEEIEKIKEKYPQLLFKNLKRKFMEK